MKLKQTIIRTPLEDISRKDLLQVCPILKKKLNKGTLQYTIDCFQKYLKNKTYVKYQSHLGGISHHSKLGPARRPLKIYRYLIQSLKGLKETFNNLKKPYQVERVLINSTGYLRGGIIRASRGRAFMKKRKQYNLVLVLKSDKHEKEKAIQSSAISKI